MSTHYFLSIASVAVLLFTGTAAALDTEDADSSDDEVELLDDQMNPVDEEMESDDEEAVPEPEMVQQSDDELPPETKKEEETYDEAPVDEFVAVDSAEKPVYKPISIGALLGYGIVFKDTRLNPFGLGFGIRGGYKLDMGLYLGAQFIYFLGATEPVANVDSSANIITAGLEAGFELQIEPIAILPSIGFGLAIYKSDIVNASLELEDNSSTDFYIAPGASILYPVDMFFIGADIRINIVLADESTEALTIMATGGIQM